MAAHLGGDGGWRSAAVTTILEQRKGVMFGWGKKEMFGWVGFFFFFKCFFII